MYDWLLQYVKMHANWLIAYICSSGLQDYEGDELLVVYDPPFKFGQNFYLCLTEEAKDRHLNVSA